MDKDSDSAGCSLERAAQLADAALCPAAVER